MAIQFPPLGNVPSFGGVLDSLTKAKKLKEGRASPLNDFISTVKSNGIMPLNRFTVEFALPKSISTIFGGSNSMKVMMCHGLNLPGIVLTTQQSKTYGEYREFPYEKLFNNINMNFYITSISGGGQLSNITIFNEWMNSIQNPYTREFSYYDDYITDITVTIQDKAEDDKHTVKFFECYPKSIGDINMEYSSRDVMTLPVSMNYKYWRSVNISSDTVPISNQSLGSSVTVGGTPEPQGNFEIPGEK